MGYGILGGFRVRDGLLPAATRGLLPDVAGDVVDEGVALGGRAAGGDGEAVDARARAGAGASSATTNTAAVTSMRETGRSREIKLDLRTEARRRRRAARGMMIGSCDRKRLSLGRDVR